MSKTEDVGVLCPRRDQKAWSPFGEVTTQNDLNDTPLCDKKHSMGTTDDDSPISALLRRSITDAIEQGRETYLGLETATGLTRASIMRFCRGSQSLRLDMADRLARHFGLELRPVAKGRNRNG